MIARLFSLRRLSMRGRQRLGAGLLSVAALLASNCGALAAESRVIQEQYPSGSVRIECEVTIDGSGNVLHDGLWRKWNPAGTLICEGHYACGERVGTWTRWLHRDEAEILFTAPFDQFEAPFLSRANFVAGELDGEWVIADARGRICSRVTLKNGQRNGLATLWLPDGRLFRESHFLNGLPSGELRELGPDGNVRTVATFVDGLQVVNNVTCFPEREDKHIEATCVVAVVSQRAPDDYVQTSFSQYAARKKSALHGPWRSWYSNGQLQCEGRYENNRESGLFTWWHANGTVAAQGNVVGGEPAGIWTWWYANGKKAAESQFSPVFAADAQPPAKHLGEKPISASFTPARRAAVTRKNRQLY
jgi:antitoxin component YwqK of YwqJK toxin-antitoxin module